MPFNKSTPPTITKTVNLAGGDAYNLDDATALYISVSTNLGSGTSDSYYKSANTQTQNILNLVAKVAKKDPAFIFQLAAYTRQEMHLRSIPTVLFIEGIRAMHNNKPKGAAYPVDATQFATQVFSRPDELGEALAYWLDVVHKESKTDAKDGKHKLPKPLINSLAAALNAFNEYGLVKYASDSKSIKMKDVVRLVHPTPSSEAQEALYNYFIRGVDDNAKPSKVGRRPLTTKEFDKYLPQTSARDKVLSLKQLDASAADLIKRSGITWENLVSKFGSNKQTWEMAIPKMGYMALLRNINNFVKAGVDLKPILDKLADPEQVRKSKQLPFRFFSALKASVTTDPFAKQELNKALSKALEGSIANVPVLPGRTFVTTDVSGSMQVKISAKSEIKAVEIGAVMSALALHMSGNGIGSAFGTTFAVADKGKTLLDTANVVMNLPVGWSTNAHLAVKYLLDNKIAVDRVLIFTDMQCYVSPTSRWGGTGGTGLRETWVKYRNWLQTQGKDAYMYEVNLVGGNTSNFTASDKVLQLGGWSDKIFDLIAAHEEDPRKVIKKIKEKYPVNDLVTA